MSYVSVQHHSSSISTLTLSTHTHNLLTSKLDHDSYFMGLFIFSFISTIHPTSLSTHWQLTLLESIHSLPQTHIKGCKPAVWGPEARTWSLGAEQLHGRNWVVEEVAEAEHGTNQNTRRSTTILKAHNKADIYFISNLYKHTSLSCIACTAQKWQNQVWTCVAQATTLSS